MGRPSLPKLPEGEYWTSASQQKTFADCKRWWYYKSVLKIKEPKGPAMQAGIDYHLVGEIYLTDGTIPEEDHEFFKYYKMFRPTIKYLPEPGTCRTETQLIVRIPGAGAIVGYIDVEHEEGDVPVNYDHKSTSDFKWAMTEDELRDDIAGVIYGKHRMDQTGSDKVINRWIYGLRSEKSHRAKRVEVTLTRDEIEPKWNKIVDTAREMQEIRNSGIDVKELPPSPVSCSKYRGCPHQDRCNLTTQEKMRGHMAQANLKERMANRRKKVEAPEAEAKPATATPTTATVSPLDKMRNKKKAAPKAEAAPAPKPEPVKATGVSVAKGGNALERFRKKKVAATIEAPINPPESQIEPEPEPEPVASAPEQVPLDLGADTVQTTAPGTVAGLVLCIDCAPVFGTDIEVLNYSVLIQRLEAATNKAYTLKAEALEIMAMEMDEFLRMHPLDAVVILPTASREAGYLLGVLQKHASLVIQ